MPRLICRSPSESNSTILRFGSAIARPSPKPEWPPIAGSPSGMSRAVSLILIQCLPPRPEMTMASPRCFAKTLSMSAVLNIACPLFRAEAVVFVADEYRQRPLVLCRFLERDVDARRICVVLDEVVVDVERVQKALGIGRRGVGRDAVARPAA